MRENNIKEWIAGHDDQAIPPRVKIRVFDRFGGRCAECSRKIGGSIRPAYDHIQALCNGGSHRESNLQLLCMSCHAIKTKQDVAEKKINARVRAKHIGARPSSRGKLQSRGFEKREPQRTASRPLERRS
jgi:5-methylcytosine-specific restriction protein A